MVIHPTAIVDASAQLGRDVVVGPYVVIEAGVTVGDDCQIDAFTVIKTGTTLGQHNRVSEHVILGGLPQHASRPTDVGSLIIGDNNTIRENSNLHRALKPGKITQLGNNCYLMAGTHIAHDCVVGNNTIFANNATLGGFVTVEERAYVSGNVAVHQFCKIGRIAMLAGLARVVKDVPPYVTIDGQSGCVVGLNTVGLQRAGYSVEQIAELKAAYRVIYRSQLMWNEILSTLERDFPTGPAAHFAEFLHQVTRGIVLERRAPPGATLKLHEEVDPVESTVRRNAA